MTKGAKIIIAVVVVLIIIWAAWAIYSSSKSEIAATPANTEPIKIGFIGPLTGDMAEMGENIKAGTEIAVEEINKSGGINGRQVVLVAEDGKCSGQSGVNAAAKLINIDKVVAIVGPTCSGETLSAAPVAEGSKIPMISPCSTSPKVSEAGDYIFRNVPSDNFQAVYAAGYIMNTLKIKNVAVLYENMEWGIGLKDSFLKAFNAVDGKVTTIESFESGSKDLRTILAKVKKAKPDLIYFLGMTETSSIFAKQVDELGIKIPAFGGDSWDDATIWEKVGSAGNGMMFTAVASNSTDDFKAQMRAKLNTDKIVYCSNYAYDGLKMLAKVIGDVGTDGTAIKNALYKLHYEGGVGQPTYDFDDNGDPSSAVYSVKVVKDGKAELIGAEKPVEEPTTSTSTPTAE